MFFYIFESLNNNQPTTGPSLPSPQHTMPATQSRQLDNGTMSDEQRNAAITEAQRRRYA
eukprot:COSAG01_NODE_67372_length_267_cov_0.672619_1_plen_58_part_10